MKWPALLVPRYKLPIGNVWTGVKIYFGHRREKTFAFVILGGCDNCETFPSGKGLYVEYPDGVREWKDRGAIETSWNFFTRVDDQAIKKRKWVNYEGCL